MLSTPVLPAASGLPGHHERAEFPVPSTDKEKPPQLLPGRFDRLALAAFVKRPQADAQIGAMAQTYRGLLRESMAKLTKFICDYGPSRTAQALFATSGETIPA
jgi:hypothetical protein